MDDIKLFIELIDGATEDDKDMMLKRLFTLVIGSNANVSRALSTIDRLTNTIQTLNKKIDTLSVETSAIKCELAMLLIKEKEPFLLN